MKSFGRSEAAMPRGVGGGASRASDAHSVATPTLTSHPREIVRLLDSRWLLGVATVRDRSSKCRPGPTRMEVKARDVQDLVEVADRAP